MKTFNLSYYIRVPLSLSNGSLAWLETQEPTPYWVWTLSTGTLESSSYFCSSARRATETWLLSSSSLVMETMSLWERTQANSAMNLQTQDKWSSQGTRNQNQNFIIISWYRWIKQIFFQNTILWNISLSLLNIDLYKHSLMWHNMTVGMYFVNLSRV